jgi:two-component system, cell cycle sensor histidine kinase and response regulator CckA
MPHPSDHPESFAPEILLIDDKGAILDLLCRVLTNAGFTVCGVASGEEAIKLFHQHGDSIHLVITDVNLSRMDGPQTIGVLREMKPGLAFCFITGSFIQYNESHLQGMGPAHVFTKPFKIDEFTAAVSAILRPKAEANPETGPPAGP